MGLRYHDRKEAPKRGKKTNTNDSSVRMSFTKLARSGGAQHTAPIRSSLWVRHRNTDWLETQWEEHNMTIVGGILCFFFRVLASPRRLFPRLFIVLGKPVSFFLHSFRSHLWATNRRMGDHCSGSITMLYWLKKFRTIAVDGFYSQSRLNCVRVPTMNLTNYS